MAKRTRPKSCPEVIDTGAIIYTQPVASSGGSGSFSSSVNITQTGRMKIGVVARKGSLPVGSGVQVGAFTTQFDAKNYWSDGSIKFGIATCDATSTGVKTISAISNPGGSYIPTWPTVTVAFTRRANTHWPVMETTGTTGGTGTVWWYRISTVNASSKESFATPPLYTVGHSTPDGSNFVSLSWASVSGASSYRVYRASSYYGTYGRVYNSTGTSFNDTTGVADTGNQPKADTSDDPGTTYTATLGSFDGTDTWLNGAVCREARVRVIPVDGSANPMGANLEVVFDVTSFAAGGHRVHFQLENVIDHASMDKFGPFDVVLTINGSTAFSATQVTSYSMSRDIHKRAWTSGTAEAQYEPDFEEHYVAKILPRIQPDVASNTYTLSDHEYDWPAGGFDGGQWHFAILNPDMAAGGGRPELNYVHGWEASYLLHKTQNQRATALLCGDYSAAWPFHLTKSNHSIPHLGDSGYAVGAWWFDGRAGSSDEPLCGQEDFVWKGNRGRNGNSRSDVGATNLPARYNEEHVSTPWFLPYLLTGDRFYVDQAKHWANACILFTGPGWTEIAPTLWPGLFYGRDGGVSQNKRILTATGPSREYGWPLKCVTSAALMVPDSDADRTYFIDTVQNNLQWISDRYDLYVSLGRGGTHHGGMNGVERAPALNSNANEYWRQVGVSSVTNTNPSTITTSTAHHYDTGDYVWLEAGTPVEYQITVTGANTFTVPANVFSLSFSNVTKLTTQYGALWRYSYTMYATDWILRNKDAMGWTDPGSAQAAVDGLARFIVLIVKDNSSFASEPGLGCWYPSANKMDGRTFSDWFDTFAEFDAFNRSGWIVSGATAGSPGYNVGETGSHLPEFEAFSYLAKRRGITGAQAAIDQFSLLSAYFTDRNTTSYQQGVAIHFGSEVD